MKYYWNTQYNRKNIYEICLYKNVRKNRDYYRRCCYMKKWKNICSKLLVIVLACIMICPVGGTQTIYAAGISRDDAFEVYIYVLRKWLEQGVYVTVNNDISNYVTDTRKRPTERIPLCTIFDEEEGYSTIEDLNGDGMCYRNRYWKIRIYACPYNI